MGTKKVINKSGSKKAAASLARRAAVGDTLISRGCLSLMQTAAVAPSTAIEYEMTFARIVEWESNNFGKVPENEAEMCWVMIRMFDEWFLEGETLATARKALAALCFFRPHFGKGAGCQLTGSARP